MSRELINAWASEQGLSRRIDVPGAALSFTLGDVRVTLRELSQSNILITARVADIPLDATGKDNLLRRALEMALGRVRDSACVLTADSPGGSLWLQLRADAVATTRELGARVEDLVNEVDLWREVL